MNIPRQKEYQNEKRRTAYRGFTIVEVLIVVVVIAVLASITIVSYNGITTRAESAKTSDAVSAYLRTLVGYRALNGGNYPTVPDAVPFGYVCIGEPGTRCGNLTDNTYACFGVADVYYDSSVATQMNTLVGSSQPSTQKAQCGGKEYGGAFYAKRAYQPSTGLTSARVVWFLPGDQSCDTVATKLQISKSFSGNVTRCLVYLPED